MATLREYFDTDFTRVLNGAQRVGVNTGAGVVQIDVRVHFDFEANAKYLSCYLTVDASTPSVCEDLITNLGQLLTVADGLEVRTGFPGEALVVSGDLQFAGRVYLYHEGAFDDSWMARFTSDARSRNIFVQWRGQTFALERTKVQKPLAFISHDSRDKDQIARPIAVGLSKLMCPVWFDEFSLRVGDRLRESIERGLREARKCVLVLTPQFLGNDGWTKTEFNSVFTRELVEGKDVVLPVWHDVSRQQVYEYSPTLADRVALQWTLGEDVVVHRLRRALIE